MTIVDPEARYDLDMGDLEAIEQESAAADAPVDLFVVHDEDPKRVAARQRRSTLLRVLAVIGYALLCGWLVGPWFALFLVGVPGLLLGAALAIVSLTRYRRRSPVLALVTVGVSAAMIGTGVWLATREEGPPAYTPPIPLPPVIVVAPASPPPTAAAPDDDPAVSQGELNPADDASQVDAQQAPQQPYQPPVPPAPTQPAPVEPAPVEPVQPAPVEPVQPAPVEPVQPEPAPVEPAPTEPVEPEPAPVEPVEPEPAPAEPEPSAEPAPADPTTQIVPPAIVDVGGGLQQDAANS